MPDGMNMPAGQPPVPGGATPPGAGGAPPMPGGQSTGMTPATMPIQNGGIQAKARASLANVIKMLHMIAAAIGPGDEAAKEIDRAISGLSKVAPPNAQSEGVMRADLAQMAAAQRAHQMQAMAMRQQGAPAAPPPPPAGVMPQAA